MEVEGGTKKKNRLEFNPSGFLALFVGAPGFEPGTPWSQTRYTTGLCYTPNNSLQKGRENIKRSEHTKQESHIILKSFYRNTQNVDLQASVKQKIILTAVAFALHCRLSTTIGTVLRLASACSKRVTLMGERSPGRGGLASHDDKFIRILE